MEENKNEKAKIVVVSIIFLIVIFIGIYLVDSKINNISDNNLEQNIGDNIDKKPSQNDKGDILEDVPNEDSKPLEKVEVENNDVAIPNALNGNSLEDFDLTFLKIENQKSNKIYSPISH